MRGNIVVIGAVALGPKAACPSKRLNPVGRVSQRAAGPDPKV